MKIVPAALAILALLADPPGTAAQTTKPKPQHGCVRGAFDLEFDGQCTAESVVKAYADQVFNTRGAVDASCTLDAGEDLGRKLAAAGLKGPQALCDKVYSSQEKVPFTDASKRGKDLHFEDMFYKGHTDWQEEVETLYESKDRSRTSHFKDDGEQIRAFHEGAAQGRRVDWPGKLTNFRSSVTDDDGLPTCETGAAMCVWPKDRQANDNNGNCATPYDQNCVDKDVADNTNLCFVDPERGSNSTGLNFAGNLVYPGDNGDGEGSIHCHGLAWSNDVNHHTARYKANNLFFVSMYDHLYQRGYVKNIPGAPMCGCVEQMPTVSRCDCTQVDLKETVLITYDPDNTEPFESKLSHVHVDFNACRGINNRNNDLWAYIARLYYEGNLKPKQFGEAGRIITNTNCDEATQHELGTKGMVRGYDHDVTTWTKVAGRDTLHLAPYGKAAFGKTLTPSTEDRENTHYGVIYRACISCIKTHQKIFYRRRTPVPADFNLLDNILYRNNNGGGHNTWTEDFSLHSTYEDALKDANPWKCPSNRFDYNYNFYGTCSPTGARIRTERSRFDYSWDRKDVAYYTNRAEDELFEVVPTTAINGRGNAGGIALKDKEGNIYMTGRGWGIHWVRDDCNSLLEKAEGDHTITVHVGSLSAPEFYRYSKVGIMFRANMAADSPMHHVYLTGSQGVCSQTRFTKGHHPHQKCGFSVGAKEAWLKAVKRGNQYTSYVGAKADATSPVTWTEIDTRDAPDIYAEGSYHIGLALASEKWKAMEAVFQDYQVEDYYFPSAAPSTTAFPTVAEPVSVIGEDAVASQVCTYWIAEADWAIDGKTGTTFGSRSVSHTCYHAEPWWQVDLGREETTITNIVIKNRSDCCQNRLDKADVEILDADDSIVASQKVVGALNEYKFKFPNVVGKKVRIIQRARKEHMNIAEVEVFGFYTAPSAAPSMTIAPTVNAPKNLARDTTERGGSGIVASQSSTCHGGVAARAIDGKPRRDWGGRSVQHTCHTSNPWWKVDLGRDVQIYYVMVYNRSDCCRDRLGGAQLEILDASDKVVAAQPFVGAMYSYRFDFGVVGRSVKVNRKAYGSLNIAEVEVYGA